MESNTVVLRGFSNTFGMDKKLDIVDLQFIEGEELERAWKTARRQRLKQQEEKIWSEFVKEEDVLQSVCKEDPYQFLDQIPQEQVDELVECELSRFKKELEAKNAGAAGDSPRFQKPAFVTFNDIESEEMFEIYDDNDSEQVAEENLNESLESPCTVRERDDTSGDNTERKKDRKQYIARASGASIESSTRGPATKNSNENVTTVIENSIYCAKVKDLRNKIVKELQDMINSLENQNVASIDPNLLRKFCKRAAEFSARFQRIHLYQLQRQVNDLKRHNSLSTPYGKHTQFQSQMVRIVALHQNTLQSLQVFHKSFEQTACLRECSAQLRMICSTLRDSTAACLEVRVPNDLSAAQQLYNDNLLSVCDDLENGVTHYIARVDEYVGAAERMLAARGKRSKSKKNWSQKATKNTTSGPNQSLSMYSLDTLRLNSKPIGKANKESIKTGKIRLDIPSRVSKRGKIEKDAPKSHRKTPRRRPLMRDPHAGAERRARSKPDHDIQTMVEAVETQSSHAGDSSPNRSFPTSPRNKAQNTPHHQPPLVPPIALNTRSPRVPPPSKRSSPYTKPLMPNLRSEADTTQNIATAVHRAQCTENKSIKSYKPSDDFTVQTRMSESMTTSQTPKSTPVKADSFRGVENKPRGSSAGSKSRLDTARSDVGRLSQRSTSKIKEAEGYEMTKLLKHLCAGDNVGNKNDRASGSTNAQLVCVNAISPRQPTTPQLLKILEETIQKKIPENMYKIKTTKDSERLRLAFNIPQQIADNLFQYRTKFVQHMLTSSMYANSAIGKPWEVVGCISEQIIDEILMQCAEEMQIKPYIMQLYMSETRTQ